MQLVSFCCVSRLYVAVSYVLVVNVFLTKDSLTFSRRRMGLIFYAGNLIKEVL